MPVPWLTVLQSVPWTDVIKNAPKVAEGARKLWNTVGKKPSPAAEAAVPVPAGGDAAEAAALRSRVAALETSVADLQAQMVASSEVIKALADQNAQLVAHVASNQRRWLWTLGATALVAVAAAAALVLVFLWRQPHV
jgi:hypothetical protein